MQLFESFSAANPASPTSQGPVTSEPAPVAHEVLPVTFALPSGADTPGNTTVAPAVVPPVLGIVSRGPIISPTESFRPTAAAESGGSGAGNQSRGSPPWVWALCGAVLAAFATALRLGKADDAFRRHGRRRPGQGAPAGSGEERGKPQ